MKTQDLTRKLAVLTGALRPGAGVTAEELDEVRPLLARQLARTELAPQADLESILEAALPEVEAPVQKRLEKAATAALRARQRTPSTLPAAQVYRRAVPFVSGLHELSSPAWAAGQAVDHTAGPFYDALGRPYWFDVYFAVKHRSMVRAGSTAPIALFSTLGVAGPDGKHYTLAAGTVWILSSLLAPGSPAGGYCGLRVKSGTVALSEVPVVIDDATFQIGAAATATLKLNLDPPAATPSATAPGLDASASECTLPASVTFVLKGTQCTLTAADAAQMRAYENLAHLTFQPGAAAYEPLIRHVLLPFKPDVNSVVIAAAESDLFVPRGEAMVKGAAWALPVTVAPPASLGQAAGAGALTLRLAGGLSATWRGLEGGSLRLGPSLLTAGPNALSLVTSHAANPAAEQELLLWRSGSAAPPSTATLRFAAPFPLSYLSLSGTSEGVLLTAGLEVSLDRPVRADGRRIPLRADAAAVAFWQDTADFWGLILTALNPDPQLLLRPMAMALTNALLRVLQPPAFGLFGRLPDPHRVQDGGLAVPFWLSSLVPTLRDPYVANFRPVPFVKPKSEVLSFNRTVTGALIAFDLWHNNADPELKLWLLPPAGGTAGAQLLGVQPLPASAVPPLAQGEELSGRQKEMLASAAHLQQVPLRLLDVSSNLDQWGVGLGLPARRSVGAGQQVAIRRLSLEMPGQQVRIFLLPQVQWEPVINVPNPNIGPYPSPAVSADDGVPAIIGTQSVALVPVSPDVVIEEIVRRFDGPAHDPAAAVFTLPFGMIAAATFCAEDEVGDGRTARLWLNRPQTADERFRGGLQLAAQAFRQGYEESPSFAGFAFQTRNLVHPYTRAPLGMSVLSGDISNDGVHAFFNLEMLQDNPRVPVTRIDLAGYGESLFSNWFNPNALAGVSQARFDVLVGRTAHEVIQIASVLYPWAPRVVRTVTLERRGEARVFRYDSGWVAVSPGVYDFPKPDPSGDVWKPDPLPPILTHPGVVLGAYNVRRIRETGRVVRKRFDGVPGTRRGAPEIANFWVELLEVRFDADFQIQGVDGLVTARDQIGFVQRRPLGFPLMPAHYAAMLGETGPMGGALDCWINVGNSGQPMHVARVDVDTAPSPDPTHPIQFAAAARGALTLSRDGAWSVMRRTLPDGDLEPVHQDTGVSLVRAGTPAPSGDYRFADPADTLREGTPAADFVLLQSSAGHQAIFPRPKVVENNPAIVSTQKPLLADAYALSTAAGQSAKPGTCFAGVNPYTLAIDGQGRYSLGTIDFGWPASGQDRALVASSVFGIRTHYDKTPTLTLDPTQPQSWRVDLGEIATSMSLGPFADLMTISHNFKVGDGLLPSLTDPVMGYAPFLDTVKSILEVLEKLLGIDSVIEVLASFGSFNFSATLSLPIEDPDSADGFISLGGMRFKGKLAVGIRNRPEWTGFLEIGLGLQVPIVPPVMGGGELAVKLTGSELVDCTTVITAKWGASVGMSLGPLSVSGSFYYGIQVTASTAGTWGIGLLLGVAATADLWIVSVTVRVDLMATLSRVADGVQAEGQARFAAEIEVCWFLTISVDYTLEYGQTIDI